MSIHEMAVVHHDPLGGMPTHVSSWVPAWGGEDGDLTMVPASDLPDPPLWVPPLLLPDWLEVPASGLSLTPIVEEAESSAEAGGDETDQDDVPGTVEHVVPVGGAALVSAPPGSYRLLTSPAEYLKSADLDTSVWFRPNGKKLSSNNSGHRYAAYSSARSVREYLRLAGDPKFRTIDLQNDLAKGLCLLVPGPGSSKVGMSMVAVVRSLDWCVHEHQATNSLAETWDHIAMEQNELASGGTSPSGLCGGLVPSPASAPAVGGVSSRMPGISGVIGR